jgi:hypothetical protein
MTDDPMYYRPEYGHQLPSPPNGGSRGPGRPSSMVTPTGHDREKWLYSRLRGGAGLKFKAAAESLLSWAAVTDESSSMQRTRRAAVVEHIHQMLDEMERWKDAWASEKVARDRAVRAALDRPNCEIHEAELTELRERGSYLEVERTRAEKGRLALVNGLDEIDRVIDGYDVGQAIGRQDLPPLTKLLREVSTRVHNAHRRAWK